MAIEDKKGRLAPGEKRDAFGPKAAPQPTTEGVPNTLIGVLKSVFPHLKRALR